MRIGYGSLASLPLLRNCRRRRASSWDRSGANADFWVFEPGEVKVLADIRGAGCIKHIWMTMSSKDEFYARKVLLRMYWDGEDSPSVHVPIGDFFGIGHGIVKNFVSLPLSMGPQDGRGFNCWFPMPFSQGAQIEVVNETNLPYTLYFYIDYEEYDTLEGDYGRFHAQWRRENPTVGWGENNRDREYKRREIWSTPNLSAEDNYVILEAHGRGAYVGCHLDIDCFERQKNDWYGEGDDMIFIDGEPWPPSLHGTGTEDYFCMAYCPKQEFNTPYYGLTVYSGTEEWPWKGKNSCYRYHIEDPIYFQKSILVTIEHGHANNLSNDYSSTAYWYQTEPHAPFPPMLSVEQRLPRR